MISSEHIQAWACNDSLHSAARIWIVKCSDIAPCDVQLVLTFALFRLCVHT